MDRNSILGLLLIGGILIGWMYLSQPSEEERARIKHERDSVALAQKQLEEKNKPVVVTKPDTGKVVATADTAIVLSDSAKAAIKQSVYGIFSNAIQGTNENITIENERIKVSLSTKGGRISSVQLKEYKRHDGSPLVLFDADSSYQALQFITVGNKAYSTDSFYFAPTEKSFTVTGEQSKSIALRLYGTDKKKYIEYLYTLKGNSYNLGYKINMVGMQDVIAPNMQEVGLSWGMKTPSQEKNIRNERMNTTVYFKDKDEEADYLSETSDEQRESVSSLKWVSFKQQFFTSVLMADSVFPTPIRLTALNTPEASRYVRSMATDLTIPYNHNPSESFGMSFYFGPNHYQTLAGYDLGLQKQIPLGWGIFGWVNRFIVIPIFNFLDSFNLNYGIVILILTLIIKLLLFPIAYKTYLSSAKMRVLKPEIDEINKKFEKEDPMKKQQAVMTLYRKAGVNPLAGCIPLLLQMPILIALFRFFPASIELRQQSFLWADDLSSYDSIYDFGFNIPFYGDHISLFTLLMTASTYLYTYSNMQLMGSQQQMPGMKFMMYVMPIMFLGFMNDYSAGLSYYYFLANMITFGQTYAMRAFVDEDALRRRIEENKKKPVKVSSFQQKLEKMAKERQQMQRKK